MSETEALTVPETRRGIITRDVLTEAAEQRKLLAEYVRAQMVEGTDYGKIPGTDKPTLLKPGAEKLTELFRCTPKFKLVKEIEDYDKNLFAYTFRVQLYQRDAGAVLAEGYGSANSREGRYRWRNANPRCPSCGKEALFRSRNDPGFYCWSKKGGCGAKFGAGDPGAKAAFESAGKVENDDVATLANTILKMAKKRALVDGAIALARVSDLFAQDLEDLPHGVPTEDAPPPPIAEKPAATNGHANGKPAAHSPEVAEALAGIAEMGTRDAIAKLYENWKAKHKANAITPAEWTAIEKACKSRADAILVRAVSA